MKSINEIPNTTEEHLQVIYKEEKLEFPIMENNNWEVKSCHENIQTPK